jgi:hypothetical protein
MNYLQCHWVKAMEKQQRMINEFKKQNEELNQADQKNLYENLLKQVVLTEFSFNK